MKPSQPVYGPNLTINDIYIPNSVRLTNLRGNESNCIFQQIVYMVFKGLGVNAKWVIDFIQTKLCYYKGLDKLRFLQIGGETPTANNYTKEPLSKLWWGGGG